MTTLDDEFLKVLAAKGIVPDGKGMWAADPKHKGTPPPAEMLRYLNETAGKGDINAQLRRQWVANLEDVTGELVKHGTNAPWPYYSVFWIRLHGLFTDIAPFWERTFQVLGLDRKTYKAVPESLAHLAQFVLGTIDEVRERLTEDELVYLDYKRQSESHPVQSAYDLQVQKGGKILDKRRVPTLDDKTFTIAQADAAIRRVLKAHRNELEIAVAFAKRIAPELPQVIDAMNIGASRKRSINRASR